MNRHPLATFVSLAVLLVSVMLPVTAKAEGQAYLLKWGGSGNGPGQFFSPAGITVDNNGRVYVLDLTTNRIQKFTNDGVFVQQWTLGTYVFPGPLAIAVGPDGLLYVADPGKCAILKYTTTGAAMGSWGVPGSADGQLNTPAGVAVDAAGNVFVSDTNNDRIQKFSSTGVFLGKWNQVPNRNPLDGPEGIVVDAAGFVYVADKGNHRVVKFDGEGNFITEWNGSPLGPFFNAQPDGLGVGADGHVFTTQMSAECRVQEFTATGEFVGLVGIAGIGRADGQFWDPVAVAVDANLNIFVSDKENRRVQKFGFAPTPTASSTWGRIKALYR